MKSIAISALALSLSAGAAASQERAEDGLGSGIVSADDMNRLIRAETIMDSPIYSLSPEGYEGEWEESEYYEGWQEVGYYDAIGEGWEQVGEVSDIVLSPDGNLVGIVAEVGGFLGLGDSQIVLDLSQLKLVRTGVGAGVGVGVGEEAVEVGEEEVGAEEGVGEGVGAGLYEGGEIAFVTRYSEEQLENMEELDEGWF